MSLRVLLRRVLPADRRFVAASVLCLAMTAGTTSAMAATPQSLSIQSCTFTAGSSPSCPANSPQAFPAGGDPSLLTTATLDTAAATGTKNGTVAPTFATVALEPGVLASAAANPACLSPYTGPPPACVIGGGSISTSIPQTNPSFVASLTPATKAGDLAGITLAIQGGSTVTGEITLVQSGVDKPVSMVLTLDLRTVPAAVAPHITGMTLFIGGTLNGVPFLRMPTNCTVSQHTTLSVTYGTGASASTESGIAASPDVAPAGCSSLAYAPKLTATATKDASDSGVDVTTVVTQAAAEAVNQSVKLTIPSGTIQPNLVNAVADFGKQVGVAQAVSPLLPIKVPGTITLTGNAAAPALTISFPLIGVSFSGTIDLGTNSVTFGHVPDLPLTNLTVDLSGGPTSLFQTSCSQPTGTLNGAFIGQNGATGSSAASVTIAGCSTGGGGPKVTKPTVSGGSLTGLKSGSPKLGFTLKAGQASGKLVSFTVSLPKGLSFVKKGIAKGVSVSGAKIKKVSLKGGKLVVTLKSGVTKLKVKITSKALKESAGLKAKVIAKKVKTLKAGIVAKDSTGKTTKLTLTLKV